MTVKTGRAALLAVSIALCPMTTARDLPSGTNSDLPEWMRRLPAADPSLSFVDVFDQGRKVTLDGWTRNGYVLAAGAPRTFELAVEPGMRLEFSFALHPEDPGAPPPPMLFHADARDPNGFTICLALSVLDGESCERWVTLIADVDALAGRRATISIRVDPAGEAPAVDAPPTPKFTALVAEPVVLRTPVAPPWNVVLLSIDTLRADHLSCYGYARRTSPCIDALAAEGVRFAWDVSPAPWTTPAHMSMLTGLYPSGHHVNGSFEEQGARGDEGPAYRTLDRATPTLAERLRAAGWRTHALTAGVCVEAWLGFDHGFDSFHVGTFKLTPSVPAEVDGFLASHAATPFFLFLHTYEVHEQYVEIERGRQWLSPADSEAVKRLLLVHSPDEIAGDPDLLTKAGLARSEVLTAFYDAGVETADAYVGFVERKLKEMGLWERTLLVVTADHGQELADHDPGQVFGQHGHTLYDELLHVPLLMHVPDANGRGVVVDGLVQTVDVTPTILDLLGLEPAAEAQGVSLAALAREGGVSPRPIALSESTAYGQEWKSLRTRTHKFISGFDLPSPERSGIPGPPAWEQLYDLAADPREQSDLLGSATELAERLRDRMLGAFTAITRPIGATVPGQVPSEETLERLRRLGYVR